MNTSTEQKPSTLKGILYIAAPIAFIYLALFVVRSFGTWVGILNLFQASTCTAPCWNGITPGVTTQDEALQVLGEISAVYQTRINLHTQEVEYLGLFDGHISFEMLNNNLYPVHGTMLITDNLVEAIILDNNLNLTLSDAVALYGDPEYVIIINYWGYVIGFLHSENGVFFSHDPWGEQTGDEENISPHTLLTRVILFDADWYSQLAEIGMFSQGGSTGEAFYELLMPWNGYGSMSEVYLASPQ